MDHQLSAAAARPVRIGDPAPEFAARTTAGDVSLSDYRGRWLLFFSHPGDFTPVCTSEFVALARAAPRFDALGCALLGLSVDSLFAHIAWLQLIRRSFGVTIPFPIVEDPSMAVARAYGMLDESAQSAATVRASFVIDPSGIIQALSWYPANVGRSVEESLRLVAALQRTAGNDVMTPEGWQPGEDLLLPPYQRQDDAYLQDERGSDWFYRTAPDK